MHDVITKLQLNTQLIIHKLNMAHEIKPMLNFWRIYSYMLELSATLIMCWPCQLGTLRYECVSSMPTYK